MSPCTKQWAQCNSDRPPKMKFANLPRSRRHQPQNTEPFPKNTQNDDEIDTIEEPPRGSLAHTNDDGSMSRDEMTVSESIDGESLNTREWRDLIEAGKMMEYELGEMFAVPMTIEVFNENGSDDYGTYISSDDSMMSDDESTDGSVKELLSSSVMGFADYPESERDNAESFRI